MTLPRRPLDRIHRGRKTGPKPLPRGEAFDTRLTVMVQPVTLAAATLMAERHHTTVSAWVRGLVVAALDPALTPRAEAIVQRWAAEDGDASGSAPATVAQP